MFCEGKSHNFNINFRSFIGYKLVLDASEIVFDDKLFL